MFNLIALSTIFSYCARIGHDGCGLFAESDDPNLGHLCEIFQASKRRFEVPMSREIPQWRRVVCQAATGGAVRVVKVKYLHFSTVLVHTSLFFLRSRFTSWRNVIVYDVTLRSLIWRHVLVILQLYPIHGGYIGPHNITRSKNVKDL